MADNLDLRVRVLDAAQAAAAFKRIAESEAQVGRAGKKAGAEASTGLGHIRRGMAGLLGTVGITGVALGFKDLVTAGMRLQGQQNQLKNAMRSVGETGQGAYDKVEKAIVHSTEHGGLARDVEFQSVTNFIRLTHSSTAALQANEAAVKLARGAGLNYQSVQRYIAQALVGNVKRLQQYTGVIVSHKDAEYALSQQHAATNIRLQEQSKLYGKKGPEWLKEAEFQNRITPAMQAQAVAQDRIATGQDILARVQKKYSGTIDAYNRSTQGRLNNLKNSFEELAGHIGEHLLPIVNKFASAMGSVFNWLGKNHWAVYALSGALSFLAGAASLKLVVGGLMGMVKWLKLAAIWDGITAIATLDLGSAFETAGIAALVAIDGIGAALEAVPVIAAIAAIIVAIYMLVKHWKEVKRVAMDVWKWVKENWPLLAAIIVAPFLAPVAIVVFIFRKQLWGAMKDVWKWIKGAWRTLSNAIAFPFKWAWDHVIKPILDKIHQAVHVVSNVHHTVSKTPVLGPLLEQLNPVGHGVESWLNPFGFGKNVIKALLGSTGGHVPFHLATGGYGPRGTDTVPAWLSPNEFVLRAPVASAIGSPALNALNAGNFSTFARMASPQQAMVGELRAMRQALTQEIHARRQENFVINPSPAYFQVDGRNIAKAVVKYAIERAARGPSSLVGGSIVTGGGGPGLQSSSPRD